MGIPPLKVSDRLRSLMAYDKFAGPVPRMPVLMLVEARKEAGLTQVEVAERLGQPQSYVSRYERGERRLDVVEFMEVAKAMGVDPRSFLDRLIG